MSQPPKDKTLAELRLRHIELVTKPHPLTTPEVRRARLLTRITTIQVDLLLGYPFDEQAILLRKQLTKLAAEPLSEYDLLQRLLVLLRSVE